MVWSDALVMLGRVAYRYSFRFGSSKAYSIRLDRGRVFNSRCINTAAYFCMFACLAVMLLRCLCTPNILFQIQADVIIRACESMCVQPYPVTGVSSLMKPSPITFVESHSMRWILISRKWSLKQGIFENMLIVICSGTRGSLFMGYRSV